MDAYEVGLINMYPEDSRTTKLGVRWMELPEGGDLYKVSSLHT